MPWQRTRNMRWIWLPLKDIHVCSVQHGEVEDIDPNLGCSSSSDSSDGYLSLLDPAILLPFKWSILGFHATLIKLLVFLQIICIFLSHL